MINLDEERYIKAQKRVEELKGFYGNLVSFIVVNLGLMVINLLTFPAYLWFLWSVLGWGIGVVIHGLKVFNCIPFLGKDWEEKKIKEFMEQDNNKQIWK